MSDAPLLRVSHLEVRYGDLIGVADVSLARKVVVFHQGREISRGTPREVTSDPRVIEAYLGRRKVRHAEGT